MRIALLTTAAFMVFTPTAVFAQESRTATPSGTASAAEPAADQAAPAQAAGDQGLNDIVITAQRRSENLQNAAVAVDVVGAQDLVNAGVTQLGRLGELAPALTVEPSSTGNIVFMRGVGNFTVISASDPAIAFNYDGVYVARVLATNGSFYDLERVEVLKGPQGTLYGRNATGGAINIIPAHPQPGIFSGYGTVSYGNYHALTAEGAINVPLGDDGALRISGALNHRDGYLDDGTSDGINQALRVQLMSHLTPRLTVRISGDYNHEGGVGNSISYLGNYVFNPVSGTYAFVPSNIPVEEGIYSPASQAYRQTVTVQPSRRRLDALTPFPSQDNHFYGTNAEIDWDVGFGTLTVVPAWRHNEIRVVTDAGGFMFGNREDDDQFSIEARLAGHRIGIFDYTLGVYYFDEKIDTFTPLTLSSTLSFVDEHLTTRSFAPFGRLTANLSDHLRLVGGIRYTNDHKTFDDVRSSVTSVCVLPQPAQCPTAPLFPLVNSFDELPFAVPAAGGPPVPGGVGSIITRNDGSLTAGLNNSRVTFRGAVEYDILPRSLLYASVETGYRSGGFSGAVGFSTYDPEYITAYTLGLKNRFLDNRLQLNVEGFLWNYRNQQVNHVSLDINGNNSNFTENIGRSRIWGVEFEGRALVTRTTLLSADIQYLHARNQSFVYTSGAATPPLTGCSFSRSANPAYYDIDCSGRDAYNSPHWTVNLAAQQTIPMGDYQFVLGADTQYKSSAEAGFAYLPEERVGAFWRSNAQISFGRTDDRWSFQLFVRNIENERTPVFLSTHPTASILIAGTTAPRTYGARASFRF